MGRFCLTAHLISFSRDALRSYFGSIRENAERERKKCNKEREREGGKIKSTYGVLDAVLQVFRLRNRLIYVQCQSYNDLYDHGYEKVFMNSSSRIPKRSVKIFNTNIFFNTRNDFFLMILNLVGNLNNSDVQKIFAPWIILYAFYSYSQILSSEKHFIILKK